MSSGFRTLRFPTHGAWRFSTVCSGRRGSTATLVTDANDDPTKQIADIEDLISRGVDLLLIAPATEEALNPVVGRATKQGIPVVMVDRKVTSRENYITFVTASDTAVGRIEAQWLCEYLKG